MLWQMHWLGKYADSGIALWAARDRDARAAHEPMQAARDALTHSIPQREGPAMEAKASAEGMTAKEAAQTAQLHVNGLLVEMQRERAWLEAEGARTQWATARKSVFGG